MKKSIDMDEVLKNLEMDRSTGTLKKLVSRSKVRYGVDPKNQERLISIDKKDQIKKPPKRTDSQKT